MHIGSVDRRMTARRPTTAHSHERRVRRFSNQNFPRRHARPLHLRVTSQAKIRVGLHEHFAIDRAVRIVAGSATLPHRFVFKNEWP